MCLRSDAKSPLSILVDKHQLLTSFAGTSIKTPFFIYKITEVNVFKLRSLQWEKVMRTWKAHARVFVYPTMV
jgi:hypothetical protein